MTRLVSLATSAGLALLSGCGDGVLRSDRVLGSVELSHEAITATEGENVPLTLRILDQNGRPFDRLPPWVAVDWQSTDQSLVSTTAGRLLAVGPGEATVSVQISDRHASARVRVNPEQLTVRVQGIQLSQSVQRQDGSVPLVSGRDGFLRVFATADRINFFEAGIRVRLYHGTTLRQSWTLSAPTESIPMELTEELLTSTWNLPIAGDLIRTGMAILVDADPDRVLPTTAASRLSYPASGEPEAFHVRSAPPLRLQLIPITDALGATGRVTEANKDQFVDPLRRMFPIGELQVVVRTPPFISIYPAEFLDDWLGILYQMSALRAAEGSTDHYYGVLRRARGNLQGIGFLGYPTAVGFDVLPEAGFTLAHELGHNFDQLHTPCGDPGNVDPNYPYAAGQIGIYGLDVAAGQLMQPAVPDIMGYCQPRWVSDYIYERVLDYREESASSGGGPHPRHSMLVWGRIGDGGIRLEPAFEVDAPPQLPTGTGPYTLEGRSAAGALLFSYPFEALSVGHSAANERFFVFVVPIATGAASSLQSLHVRGRGMEARRDAAPVTVRNDLAPAGLTPAFQFERRAGRSSLSWEPSTHPMVMVRDPSTGQILSFARAGQLDLPGIDRELELVFSDGVRSTRVRARPR